MQRVAIGEAARRTGWSARMLRYLERADLVVPERTPSGYRVYRLDELRRLRALHALRRRFGVEISDVAFAARLEREPELRASIRTWLADSDRADWVDWEQRKQERLLAA
jgi:DNA-binding transcriptional MerR regulator